MKFTQKIQRGILWKTNGKEKSVKEMKIDQEGYESGKIDRREKTFSNEIIRKISKSRTQVIDHLEKNMAFSDELE